MLLPTFDFHEPVSVNEACEIMGTYGAKAKLIAGGTDLMVNMKKKILAPEHLVCLGRIGAMNSIAEDGDHIVIGGGYTVAELTVDSLVEKKLSALQSGAKSLGSPLVRNRATIAGNIGSARPAADLPPSLIAYGATAVLESCRGKREIALNDFFKGPGFTEIDVDEILTEVRVPVPADGQGAGYINLGVRKAQDCNVVNVASFIALDNKDGSIKQARIVMGSVGPTPLRAESAEATLIGEKPDEAIFLKAGQAARRDCTPIDDFRGAASYRKAMVGILTKRTLEIAHRRAIGS
ncbi:dehydrogenase [Desulfosarcina alkanivorans]|uniref:Dehydrogenase n=1 Tax=Desulfosarcina alkanivorans TaxID=571177 RepID=A0A5K7YJ32_9BACT|nr:xanthine dehydrogenase family protein subunit M [Desulfosarcina alkanivorans]BBO68130.1 dehydrogenase [Desulfosarcina alkanivorans]